ncbi:MAG: hypothetical protein JSU85_05410 [Candidatus Zixiibacteriota bacterium]|nr:MAG: hypothetical protein JSU85_05410 [candidate division Zixibacteria bacterium]
MGKKVALGICIIIILPLLIWLVYLKPGPSSVSYPPYDLTAISTPFDTAGSVTLNWFCLEGDNDSAATFPNYNILRSQAPEGPFEGIGSVGFEYPRATDISRQYRDTAVVAGFSYYYKISCDLQGETIESNIFGPISPVMAAEAAKVEVPVDKSDIMVFPPTQLRVFDTPNDAGGSITLEWKVSASDAAKSLLFNGYDIYRSTSAEGPFEKVGETTGGVSDVDRQVKTLRDGKDIINGQEYYYYVAAKWDGQEANSEIAGPAVSRQQWFHTGRGVSLVLLGILIGSILYFINRAKAGKELFIRKIAGLEAVDEAVGRATEMGRAIFYVPGIQDMNNMQTIAGLTILGRVAKLTAEYETKLEVPVSRSLVMVAAREIVKEAYLNAGRPDYYNDDIVYYLTDDQFGYAAGVDGLVIRKKPATVFYQGAFFAESLILAETGNSIGAIQIAGTAMPAQLPFFVAACDYTLIGEELFAASAYLSREPKLLGSLKGQDLGGKLIFLSLALIFVIIATIGAFSQNAVISDTIQRMFNVN